MTAKQIITKTAVNIGRLLVAVTFIFSGFVKGMDPLGTQYKITDYLEALHIDFNIDFEQFSAGLDISAIAA